MLPSRGPIQVTLEDTGSRIQCTKPPTTTTQVKILSRPRVGAIKANGPISLELGDPTTASTISSSKSPTKDCQIHRNHNNFPIKSSYSSAASSTITNTTATNANCQQQKPSSSCLDGSTTNKNITSSTQKKPLKTYQERADEYAKARLRILGSAFPENDDNLLTNSDNVNRILNLDSVSYSSSSTTPALIMNVPTSSNSSGDLNVAAGQLQNGQRSYSSCFYNNNRGANDSATTNAITTKDGYSDNRGNQYNRSDNVGFCPDSNRAHKS